MKKLMISAMMMALVSVSVVSAGVRSMIDMYTVSTVTMEDEKVEIKPEDLPDAVKKTLASDAYKEWTVSKAYSVTTSEGKHFFEVDLLKGEEKATVKLDKDGKVLE